MKLVILVILAVLAARCHSQFASGAMPPPDAAPPQPQNVTVMVVRGYRFNNLSDPTSAYQAVYENEIYAATAPFRNAHYNVSYLIMFVDILNVCANTISSLCK